MERSGAVVTPALAEAPEDALPLVRDTRLFRRRLAVVGTVTLVVSVASLLVGAAAIPPQEVLRVVLSHVPGLPVAASSRETWDAIVWEIRLPRVLLAGAVGATLAVAGTAYQGVFRNPLADPYLLGVAAGAALGATVAALTPLDVAFAAFSVVSLFAFLGALAAVTLTFLLARGSGGLTLILAGVAISSLATAVTALLMLLSDQQLRFIFTWVLGGFNLAQWRQLWLVLPYATLATALVAGSSRLLNILQLGEEEARHLGVNVAQARLLLLAAASLATAAAVSVSGIIGFVGLIVPHALRLLWGPDHRQLVPLAAVSGAGFLVAADLVARSVAAPAEIPVGIVTALCGAPFFLYVLRIRRPPPLS